MRFYPPKPRIPRPRSTPSMSLGFMHLQDSRLSCARHKFYGTTQQMLGVTLPPVHCHISRDKYNIWKTSGEGSSATYCSRNLPKKEHPVKAMTESITPSLEVFAALSSLSIQPDAVAEPGPDPATLFTIFPNFPFELRMKIWRAALPNSRLVEFAGVSLHSKAFYVKTKYQISILHVSREARQETLRVYKSIYGTSSSLCAAYIDPGIDILFLSNEIFIFNKIVPMLHAAVLETVEHIALDCSSVFFHRPLRTVLSPILKFRNLKMLTLILRRKKFTGQDLVEPFTIPISARRTCGVEIDDSLLLTPQVTTLWKVPPIDRARYLLNGMERLITVLAEYAEKNPDWKAPYVEIKILGPTVKSRANDTSKTLYTAVPPW